MSTYIISGSYSYDGIKGMMANPSDREAAVRPLIDGIGGQVCVLLRHRGRPWLLIDSGNRWPSVADVRADRCGRWRGCY